MRHFIGMLLSVCGFSFALQAAPVDSDNSQIEKRREKQIEDRKGTQGDAQRKDAIMERDQVDSTDVYAIPLDSSEIEDEEEINRLDRQDKFKILGR